MQRILPVVIVLGLLLAAPPAFAAQSPGVNPPGWIGGLLAALAIIIPLVVALWLHNRGPVAHGRHKDRTIE